MKKILYILLSFMLVGCTTNAINIDDAKQKALDDLGLKSEDVNFSKAYKDDDRYVFEFSDDEKTYSYIVKDDGTIQTRDYVAIDKNTDNSTDDTNTNNENNEILKIALDAFNVNENEITNLTITTTTENDKDIYRVKFFKDNQEYICDISKDDHSVIYKNVSRDEVE